MKALIITAGRGRRLNIKEKPKPIVRLLGLPIILRVILTAKEVGIKQFIIVTGYQGEMIKEELGNGSKYGIEIDYVENKQWERGNGISVLKAKKLLLSSLAKPHDGVVSKEALILKLNIYIIN
jgi:NDP-sugar pyrophosphorylase family protein